MSELVVTDLSCVLDGHRCVSSVSFRLAPGELVVLLGSNGAGKSTLVRAALGMINPSTGSVKLDGQEIRGLNSLHRARMVAYLPQRQVLSWPLLVRDAVALGRFPHNQAPNVFSEAESAIIERSLTECNLQALANRRVDRLSGGEVARVHAARAICSQAPLLVADEPVASLDPQHSCGFMELIKNYVCTGHGALIVMHDLPLAAQFADRLLWMKNGSIVADGTPLETLTEQRCADVYNVQASVNGREIIVRGLMK